MLVRGTRDGGAFGRRRTEPRARCAARAGRSGVPSGERRGERPSARGASSSGMGPMRGSLACKTQGRNRGLVRGTKGRLTLQKPWLTARVTASSEASAPETGRLVRPATGGEHGVKGLLERSRPRDDRSRGASGSTLHRSRITRARSSQRTSAARHGEKEARGDALSASTRQTTSRGPKARPSGRSA